MKKSIQKPENWQDFETLCKKLWGEVWNCPSIKKNGRQGQKQNGVDVYGVPKGESQYYGIQCKGKDDYSNAKLLKKEIDEEIVKAKSFKPKLKTFIFTTTANKDSDIEEYIRIKNIENIENGFFEIDLYSWEDIADLISENKHTYDWYVRNKLHKTDFSILIKANDCIDKIELKPHFIHKIYRYETDSEKAINSLYQPYAALARTYSARINPIVSLASSIRSSYTTTDFSRVGVEIDIINNGNTKVENFILRIISSNNKVTFHKKRTKTHGGLSALYHNSVPSKLFIEDDSVEYSYNNFDNVIIPKDSRSFIFFIGLPVNEIDFDLNFDFLSNEYSFSNSIHINSVPEIEDEVTIIKDEDDEERSEFKPKIITEYDN